MNRRRWMLSGLGALGASLLAGSSRAKENLKKNLLTVFVSGGWDTSYALDPKLGTTATDSPTGEIETVGELAFLSDPTRPAARAFFRFGSLATVVNGINVQSINHPDCAKRILTGTLPDRRIPRHLRKSLLVRETSRRMT